MFRKFPSRTREVADVGGHLAPAPLRACVGLTECCDKGPFSFRCHVDTPMVKSIAVGLAAAVASAVSFGSFAGMSIIT